MRKFVYLIKSESSLGEETYKIGITKRDPKKRLKELQTGNSNELEIVHVFDSEFANLLESSLHRTYSVHRLSGEWFEMEDIVVENFIEICEKSEHNFRILAEDNLYFQKHYMK